MTQRNPELDGPDSPFPISVRQGRSKLRYKVGYINPDGSVAIEAVFDEGTYFYDDLAAVSVNRRWGLINRAGGFVIQAKLWNWCRFNDGLASLANRNGKWGLIDKEGKTVIQPKHDYLGPFKNERALFRVGELSAARFGYIDLSGVEVIPPVFRDACHFSEGLAAVKLANLSGYIDPCGLFKIAARFEGYRRGAKRVEDARAGYFVNGLAPAWLSTAYGFVHTRGQVVIEAAFDEANSFCEERALIVRHKRSGFIDAKGNVVINPRFILARDFSEGLATVTEQEPQIGFTPPSGFIDRGGEMVLPLTYRSE